MSYFLSGAARTVPVTVHQDKCVSSSGHTPRPPPTLLPHAVQLRVRGLRHQDGGGARELVVPRGLGVGEVNETYHSGSSVRHSSDMNLKSYLVPFRKSRSTSSLKKSWCRLFALPVFAKSGVLGRLSQASGRSWCPFETKENI